MHGTDFSGVGLGAAGIDPGTRQLAEYNIRRYHWFEFYTKHPFEKLFWSPFWSISDYGSSGKRLVFVFFAIAIAFAAIYCSWAYCQPPGLVYQLRDHPDAGDYSLLSLFGRSVYFSIVTMTTLGFGDIYAHPKSGFGHFLY